MSILVPLLGLPSKIRKLRAHHAPTGELTPSAEVTAVYSSLATVSGGWKPTVFSDALEEQPGLNNASIVTTEVASYTGAGALDGVWVSTRTTANLSISSLYSYGLEVIVDGVDLMPAGWRHTGTFSSGIQLWAARAALGGVVQTSATGNVTGTVLMPPQFGRASAPVPFQSSLVVNLVHYETEQTLAMRTSCWVNAWKTE
jgi:hypothetical protein